MELVRVARKAVASKFLRHQILVHGSVILVDFSLQQFELNTGGILITENSHIVLEQFEKISLLIEFECRDGLHDIQCRDCGPRILEPDEAVFIAGKPGMFIEVLENETFVPGIQFRWDKVEYIVNPKLSILVIWLMSHLYNLSISSCFS